jgi:release factor glutamine methyltransferase
VTVREALRAAEERLARAGIDTPRLDAELLLAHALGVTRTQLFAAPEAESPAGFEALVARREAREPLAYVLGEWGFRRLTLTTDRRALVPRPETEIVVERCLALLAGRRAPRVLDVGVGCGAIALAIADEHPDARVTAIDVSEEALALARDNAERTGLALELRPGGIDVAAEGWDLVVSNPPYVEPEELDALQPEIRDWEPRGALVGEGFQQELARAARTELLVLEVAPRQAAAVARELRELAYDDVCTTQDLAGKDRVVEGRR